MSVIGSNILAGASGQGGEYLIERSLRFRSSASAYLNRTPASAGNRKTWTYSGWVKRGILSSTNGWLLYIRGSETDSTFMRIGFDIIANDCLSFTAFNSSALNLTTTQVFRDPSAWYHIVVAFDTTQATASNRVKIYVNGTQVTAFSTANYPALNADFGINNNTSTIIGASLAVSNYYYDGYMTEINFIDGQALTPSSFGEYSPSTGVWQAKKYGGTYGTNGFYLPFSNNASTTTLGYDFSGNSNNWTTNNISLTAGVTYDSMIDVPTLYADGGNGRGNYSTLNPLDVSISSQLTLSDGNLTATQPSTGTSRGASSTFRMSTGKWYFEGTTTVTSGTQGAIAIADNANATATYGGYRRNGGTFGLSGSPTFATYTNGDVIGVAFDADARTVSFYKNGTLQGTGGYTYTGTDPVGTRVTVDSSDSTGAWQLNYGQRPFAYTPPTGFVALNTYNLPTPTIGATASSQANKYFDATLYTGNGSTQSVTNSGSMQPDWVWVKSRGSADSHVLYDVIRGVGSLKALSSDRTAAEGGVSDNSTYGYVSALNSNGFSVTAGSSGDFTNRTSYSYVGWQWKANGTGVTNTAGSITSTVSANTTSGFSVVTYTGTGSNATVGHGLGVAPKMIIFKNRSVTADWAVYHGALGATYEGSLNTTAAFYTSGTEFQGTNPTSSVFYINGGYGVNNSGNSIVAYCFSEVAGYSKFGSYTGNGSSDGTFVYTGFRPKYVLTKRTDSTSFWLVTDSSRDTYNVNGNRLYPNGSNAENYSAWMDFTSNGFKLRSADENASGGSYIYMAFAENPMKYSLAR